MHKGGALKKNGADFGSEWALLEKNRGVREVKLTYLKTQVRVNQWVANVKMRS